MKEKTQNADLEAVPETDIPAEKVTKSAKKTKTVEATESEATPTEKVIKRAKKTKVTEASEEPSTEHEIPKRELKANCKEAQKTYRLAKWNVKMLRKKYERLLKKQNPNYKNSIFNIEISIFEAKEAKRELNAIYKSAKLQLKNRKKG